jgi:hypothetical protein
MKIRKAVTVEHNEKWTIAFKDDDGYFYWTAIPPTSGDRIDIILELRSEHFDGVHIKHSYLYNFKGNIKKLKGEKIIITITKGNAIVTYVS